MDNTNKIYELISNYIYENDIIKQQIQNANIIYNKYKYLMNNINISIIYLWNNIKKNYKYIKLKIKQNNKLYNDIIKLYRITNTIIINDNIIQEMYIKKNNNILEFKMISILHKDIYYKHNLLFRCKKTMIIYYYSDNINNIINNLYDNIKYLNKLKYELNCLQKQILYYNKKIIII